MAATYRTRDGRTITVLSAAERVTGRRGRWEVQETSVGGFTVIINGTKRAALAHAAVAARTERQLRRDLGDRRIPTPRHFVAAGIKHATCGAESPKLSTADWARVTCTACTTERDKRADAARAAVMPLAQGAGSVPAPEVLSFTDDFGATLPPSDDDHRAIVRPATSRFIGDDARNGLTAQCWECGWEIICHPHDATYRHVADAIERAHGEAIAEDRARTATVTRHRAPSGNRDNDYHQATHDTCGWSGASYSNRTIEGRRLAERDAADHRCADHQRAGGAR